MQVDCIGSIQAWRNQSFSLCFSPLCSVAVYKPISSAMKRRHVCGSDVPFVLLHALFPPLLYCVLLSCRHLTSRHMYDGKQKEKWHDKKKKPVMCVGRIFVTLATPRTYRNMKNSFYSVLTSVLVLFLCLYLIGIRSVMWWRCWVFVLFFYKKSLHMSNLRKIILQIVK